MTIEETEKQEGRQVASETRPVATHTSLQCAQLNTSSDSSKPRTDHYNPLGELENPLDELESFEEIIPTSAQTAKLFFSRRVRQVYNQMSNFEPVVDQGTVHIAAELPNKDATIDELLVGSSEDLEWDDMFASFIEVDANGNQVSPVELNQLQIEAILEEAHQACDAIEYGLLGTKDNKRGCFAKLGFHELNSTEFRIVRSEIGHLGQLMSTYYELLLGLEEQEKRHFLFTPDITHSMSLLDYYRSRLLNILVLRARSMAESVNWVRLEMLQVIGKLTRARSAFGTPQSWDLKAFRQFEQTVLRECTQQQNRLMVQVHQYRMLRQEIQTTLECMVLDHFESIQAKLMELLDYSLDIQELSHDVRRHFKI